VAAAACESATQFAGRAEVTSSRRMRTPGRHHFDTELLAGVAAPRCRHLRNDTCYFGPPSNIILNVCARVPVRTRYDRTCAFISLDVFTYFFIFFTRVHAVDSLDICVSDTRYIIQSANKNDFIYDFFFSNAVVERFLDFRRVFLNNPLPGSLRPRHPFFISCVQFIFWTRHFCDLWKSSLFFQLLINYKFFSTSQGLCSTVHRWSSKAALQLNRPISRNYVAVNATQNNKNISHGYITKKTKINRFHTLLIDQNDYYKYTSATMCMKI
jgi:hypothetical protein